jgi:hypothetical protein
MTAEAMWTEWENALTTRRRASGRPGCTARTIRKIAATGQTGCLSQYNVVPKANSSPVNIATMAQDAWSQGAIGKVAIYDFLLNQSQITKHYRVMTDKPPTGSCQDTCTF